LLIPLLKLAPELANFFPKVVLVDEVLAQIAAMQGLATSIKRPFKDE